MEDEALRGWKEIENFLGLDRKTIIAHAYPIKKIGGSVIALKEELRAHIENLPRLSADPKGGKRG